MKDTTYTYTIRDDYGNEFDLEFIAGHNNLFLDLDTVPLTDECIGEINLAISYEDDIPIGLEQIKSLELTWNLDEVQKINTDLADAIYNSTFADIDTAKIEGSIDIPFDYGNRVKISYGGAVIFEGIQEANIEKDFDSDQYKAIYNCIGAKTLIALRPIFEELGLTYSNIVSNNWTEEHTLYTEQEKTSGYLKISYTPEDKYTTYVSKTLSEIKTAIDTKAQLLFRKYRRDNTSTWTTTNWWNQALLMYEQDDFDNYSTFNNDNIRLICKKGVDPDSEGLFEDGGLLGSDSQSLFGKYDNVFEFYKDFTLNYLCKARFKYSNAGIDLEFTKVLKGFDSDTTLTDSECDLIIYENSITDYGKVKAGIVSATINGVETQFESKKLGVRNNTFYDSKIFINNAFDTEFPISYKREIGNDDFRFASGNTSALQKFYTTYLFDGKANKYVLLKVSDYCRVYLDDTTYKDVTITSATRAGRNEESGLHNALNKAIIHLFNSNQSILTVNLPYELIQPNQIGNKFIFNDLNLVLNSTFVASKLNNVFTLVSYEYDFIGYAKLTFFGENG